MYPFNKYLLSNYFEQGIGPSIMRKEEGDVKIYNDLLFIPERLRRNRLLSHHLNEDR